jgi:hypothetical protein
VFDAWVPMIFHPIVRWSSIGLDAVHRPRIVMLVFTVRWSSAAQAYQSVEPQTY